jgi:ElaB/YqjD/DUF883 family membrane-anchored ribosome-binding protein
MASSDIGSQPQQGRDENTSAVEQVKSEAGRLTQAARSRTLSYVEERKMRLADNINGMADAARNAAQQFDDHGNAAMAEYIQRAAAGLEHFSDTMRSRDVSALVDDVEGFARRQPAVFIGASVALGFLLTRFLKSSSERRDAERWGYGDDDYSRSSDSESSVGRREYQEGMTGGGGSDWSRRSGGRQGSPGGGSQGMGRQDMREGYTGASRPGGPVGGPVPGGPMGGVAPGGGPMGGPAPGAPAPGGLGQFGGTRTRTPGTEGQGGGSST